MVGSYRIRQSFSKTDAWLLRTSSLSAVFTLPANSAGSLRIDPRRRKFNDQGFFRCCGLFLCSSSRIHSVDSLFCVEKVLLISEIVCYLTLQPNYVFIWNLLQWTAKLLKFI